MHPIIILLLVNVLPVAKLREAGVVIVGKTNVPEFTIEGYTDNPLFGVTPNPWDLTVMPGGSSGRSVAAVASGRTNDGGLPIAIQFVAGLGEDEILLRLSQQIETEQSWLDEWPPVALGAPRTGDRMHEPVDHQPQYIE